MRIFEKSSENKHDKKSMVWESAPKMLIKLRTSGTPNRQRWRICDNGRDE
jgi:hypothetical protein